MKRLISLLLGSSIALNSFAQIAKEQAAIKSLCGCYEVNFKYAETFTTDTAYKLKSPYNVTGLEWIEAIEASDKKIVLQHLLVADENMAIKHWREDWEYEKSDWLLFNHDATWKHVTDKKPAATKGQWTQTVWEVDDAPRYQGSSKWVESNGKYYWENTTDAPLPRREYSKRSDYNVLQRTNRIALTSTGWLHEQDNKKIIRKDAGTDGHTDIELAEEKGYNIYTKTSDSKCAAAAAFWQKHKQFWVTVREAWVTLLKDKNTLHLIPKVDDKLLYQELDVIEEEKLAPAQLKEKVTAAISKYIDKADVKSVAATK